MQYPANRRHVLRTLMAASLGGALAPSRADIRDAQGFHEKAGRCQEKFRPALGGCTRGLALLWGEPPDFGGVGGTRPPRLPWGTGKALKAGSSFRHERAVTRTRRFLRSSQTRCYAAFFGAAISWLWRSGW